MTDLISNTITRKLKNRLTKWGFSILVILSLTMIGCAPQHHYAFKQFNTESKGEIISIQGYVLDASGVKNLERDWNLLVIEMSKKPGFVSGYLSEGVGDSKLVLAHSTWKNLESLRSAFSDKKILDLEAKLPKIQFEHLFNIGTLANYPEPFKTDDAR